MKKRLDEKAQRTIVKKLEAVGQETAVLCKELADLSTPQKRRDIIIACLTELVVAHGLFMGTRGEERCALTGSNGVGNESQRGACHWTPCGLRNDLPWKHAHPRFSVSGCVTA